MTHSRVLGLGARLNKLRGMSAAEVAHRIRYGARIAAERRAHASGRLEDPARLSHALVSSLAGPDWQHRLLESRRRNRERFLPCVSERETMRRLFATAYAAEREDTLTHAAEARQHRFEFFGRVFEYGDSIPWQSDPVSGNAWPSRYHADVPVHGGDAGYGDVKYVWELSRQQYLIDLAKSWFLADRSDDLLAIERLVRSWIDGNPYATGVNWACALEPAFRIFSWCWAYYLTSDALDDEFHLEWLRGFYDHARFIDRHLEYYTSPYNHLIAEGAALYMAGACFPEFREASRWRGAGQRVLESHLDRQFYRDGGSVEQSPFYHHATLGFYLLAALTAKAVGDSLSESVWRAIERGLEYSLFMSQPDGTTPRIGGADDGKPIRMQHLPLWDFRPYLAAGAVLFGRGDFKTVAGRFYEDALWLLGPPGLARFDSLQSAEPQAASKALGSSGYYVMRTDWSERADYLCFDCGEQAADMRPDGVSNSMHGHADCLSVIAWLGGRPLLVDSGLYAYNCGGEWEAHFRETAAHNTARVDGRDQARHLGKMAWSHSYRASLEASSEDGETAWALGSHDGYARGANGVVHRRAAWLRRDGYVLLCDEFDGTGSHELEVNFQFAPGRLESVSAANCLFDGWADIAWCGVGHWTADIRHGGERPQDGWIAPSLGVRCAAPRLTLRCTADRPRTRLLTVLASRVEPKPRVRLLDSHEFGGAIPVVVGPDHVDVVAVPGVCSDGLVRTDAVVAVCRARQDGQIESAHLGGTRVDVDPRDLRRLTSRVIEPAGVI